MEEKLFSLMEKMYIELTDIKTKMATKEDISRVESRIESEVVDKIRALYDNREVQNDLNEKISNTLNRIEAKVDVLQMETAHLRRIK